MPRHNVIYSLLILVTLILGVLLIQQFAEVLDRPEVYTSWSTKQCVEVKDPKAEFEGRVSEWSCDHLPEKYQHVWVY